MRRTISQPLFVWFGVFAFFLHCFSKSTLHISLCTRVFQACWTSDQFSRWEAARLYSIWVDPRDGCWKPPYLLHPPANFLTWTKTSTYRLMLETNCKTVLRSRHYASKIPPTRNTTDDDEPTVTYKKLLITNAVLNQNPSVSHLIIYMLIIVTFT